MLPYNGRISTLIRCVRVTKPSTSTRLFATKHNESTANDNGVVDEAALASARKWLSSLNPDTIPRDICDVSFSRSSGPGGQNVNKVSSKATLRIPTGALLRLIPPLLHAPILRSRYHASKTADLVIQADEARKQSENLNACFRRLHDLIVQAGRETVPGETSKEQVERVEKLKKAEAAGRRRMKEMQSKKKGARRGGRGDD